MPTHTPEEFVRLPFEVQISEIQTNSQTTLGFPQIFTDPATGKIMQNPVICTNGNIYDRSTAQTMNLTIEESVPEAQSCIASFIFNIYSSFFGGYNFDLRCSDDSPQSYYQEKIKQDLEEMQSLFAAAKYIHAIKLGYLRPVDQKVNVHIQILTNRNEQIGIVAPCDISTLKGLIHRKMGILPHQQRLFKGTIKDFATGETALSQECPVDKSNNEFVLLLYLRP